MTIVHSIPDISVEASGPSYSVTRLCESLVELGHELTLVALVGQAGTQSQEFVKTFPRGFGPRRLGRSPTMRLWLEEQAKSHQIGLLHNHSLWKMPNVYPGRVARKYDIPFVVAPRGTLSSFAFHSGSIAKRAFWPLFQRPALDAVTCFHATAEAEYRDIRRMGFRQPVAVIPNAVDIRAYERFPSNGPRTLLYFGRLHPEKWIDVLLRAWSVVSADFPDWRLCVAGPDIDGYRQRLTGLSATLSLERVTFAGPLYGSAKHDAYSKADLYVLPSPSENFGVTVAEALAAGTPVIATKGAPWEGLVRENAGWWIDIGTESLVATLTEALAVSPSELAEKGARGRVWMMRDFSWKTIGAQMSSCYHWLTRGGPTPSCICKA